MSIATNTLPLTYPDAVCLDDLDSFGNETSSDLQTLEQDIYHLLIESPNSNIDRPNSGIGIEDLLSGTLDDLVSRAAGIDEQLERDTRIDAAKTTLTPVTNLDGTVTVGIDIEIQVDGQVLGLSYAYSQGTGLTAVSQ